MPPLGLAWLAAVLEQAGHEVRILDAYAERVGIDRLPQVLRAMDQPQLVGISATTPQFYPALAAAKVAKDVFKEARVVLGGVHPTVLPEEALACPEVDWVVRGEGERTILDLAAELAPETIDGLSHRQDGRIVHNPDRELIADLDSLPTPAYHLLPMERYYPAAGAYKRLPAISVLATRGCPGKCTFCYRMTGARVRTRSGRRVAEEIKFLQERYGIREICFYDDTFTAIKKEVWAFLEAIDDLKMDLAWSCFSRVDAVEEDLLRAMVRRGCHQIMFGVESASPVILANVRKRTSLDRVEAAVSMAKRAGLDVRAAFMLGNPGETEQTMQETLDFAIKLNPDIVVFNITTPFPGSEMFTWADQEGYLTTKDWSKYDLAHSVMRLPTVTPEQIQAFYRKAYRRFYLRPSYLGMRLAKLRSLQDIKDAFRAAKGVLGI